METLQRTDATLPIHFQLIEIWQRVLACPVESIADNFFDLGGHSLLIARLLDEIEAETGKLILVSDFLEEPTVSGCAAALLSQPQPERLMVRLQRGQGSVPLFFFHGDILGGGFYVRRLMPHLGDQQTLYVISPALVSPDQPLPRLEDIARQRADAIQGEMPHGPYALAGFCIGGVVAYETARQLTERGEEVRTVVMIDPEIGSRSESRCLRAIDWIGDRCAWKPEEKIRRFLTACQKLSRLQEVKAASFQSQVNFAFSGVRKLCRRDGAIAPQTDVDFPESSRSDRVLEAFQWMSTAYRPRRYAGRVKLLYTGQQLEATPHLIREWRQAACNLQTRKILGRHLTAITTYGSSIAAAIRAELRALCVMSAAFVELLAIV